VAPARLAVVRDHLFEPSLGRFKASVDQPARRSAVATSLPRNAHIRESPAFRTALIEPPTSREIEVVEKLSARYSTREITEEMFISINTVRTHVRSILRKLSRPVDNRRCVSPDNSS
jgi:LuxR family maltose regulon positive regulatory protein